MNVVLYKLKKNVWYDNIGFPYFKGVYSDQCKLYSMILSLLAEKTFLEKLSIEIEALHFHFFLQTIWGHSIKATWYT